MVHMTNEELSDKLYPHPKTYEELQHERQRSKVVRMPRYVPVKLALCTACGAATIFAAFALIERIFNGVSDDPFAVVAAVSFTAFIAMIAAAIVFYLRSVIESLITVTIASTGAFRSLALLYLFIAAVIFGMLDANGIERIAAITAVLTGIVVSEFITALIMTRQE